MGHKSACLCIEFMLAANLNKSAILLFVLYFFCLELQLKSACSCKSVRMGNSCKFCDVLQLSITSITKLNCAVDDVNWICLTRSYGSTTVSVLCLVGPSWDKSCFIWYLFILSKPDSHFHKHMHQLQNPLISIMFCHKSYSWPVWL